MKYFILIFFLMTFSSSSMSSTPVDNCEEPVMSSFAESLVKEVSSIKLPDSLLYLLFNQIENKAERLLFFNKIDNTTKGGIIRGHIDSVIAEHEFSSQQINYLESVKSKLDSLFELDNSNTKNLVIVENIILESETLFNEEERKVLFYGIVNSSKKKKNAPLSNSDDKIEPKFFDDSLRVPCDCDLGSSFRCSGCRPASNLCYWTHNGCGLFGWNQCNVSRTINFKKSVL